MSPSLRRLLVFLGGATGSLAVVIFSAAPSAATRFFSWPWIFYGQVLLLVPIGVVGVQLLSARRLPARFLSALAAVAGAIALSVCFSRQPAFSFEAALFVWGGLAWAAVVSIFVANRLTGGVAWETEGRGVSRLAGFLLLVPVLASLASWLGDLSLAARPSGWASVLVHVGDYRNPHPLGHWNYTGGFALLAIPWFAGLSYIESKFWRLIWSAGLILAVIDLVSAFSRGAVLGALVGFAAAMAMATWSRASCARVLRMIALGGGLALIGVFFSNPRLRYLVAHPRVELAPDEGDVQRIGMLQGGLMLVKQRPVVGHGPGMTPFVFPEVRAALLGGVETSYQLHNGPLQLAVDSGAIGLIGWAAVAATLVGAGFKLARRPFPACPREQRVLACCSACGLAAYAGLFVTDYQFNLVPILFAVGLHAGVLAGTAESVAPRHAFLPRRVAGPALLGGVVIVFVILLPAWSARLAFWRAWQSPSSVVVTNQVRKATLLAPRTSHYFNHLGLRLALDAEVETDPVKANILRREARATLARSLEIDRLQEPVHAALGWLWLEDDPTQGAASFRAALSLLPDADGVRFGLALCFLRQGKSEAAVRQLALECLLNPSFMLSPAWEQAPLVALRRASVQQLLSDYKTVLADPQTPEWRKPRLIYGAAFTRWWFDGTLPTTEEVKLFTPVEQAGFTLLTNTPASIPEQPLLRLASLQHAFTDRARAAEILRNDLGSGADENVIAGALARLTRPHGDFSQFVRSPAPDATGIYRQIVARIHYAVMHRNIDGPGYADLTPRLIDAFTTTFVGPLLPLRGAIPGPVIISLESIKK